MPYIIPIFISHQGCPHTCVFCNQNRITGQDRSEANVNGEEVARTIVTWLSWRRDKSRRVQVAFYGGSFTGLSLERQRELLEAVRPFLISKKVHGIRLSTRPDYITVDGVNVLIDNGVETVELGVQSMDDQVLIASRRGHKRSDVERAIRLLKDTNLAVGIQLMVGLPDDTTLKMVDSVRRVIQLRPNFVRIYPVLVLAGSCLAQMYERGEYKPFSLNQAIAATARCKKIFDQAGIQVIRMGLQPSSSLEKGLLAGPYHPAFGELVYSRIMYLKTRNLLMRSNRKKVRITINSRDQSIFNGLHRKNINRLKINGLADRFVLATDPDQERHTLQITSLSSNS